MMPAAVRDWDYEGILCSSGSTALGVCWECPSLIRLAALPGHPHAHVLPTLHQLHAIDDSTHPKEKGQGQLVHATTGCVGEGLDKSMGVGSILDGPCSADSIWMLCVSPEANTYSGCKVRYTGITCHGMSCY